MQLITKTLETTGFVNDQHQLFLHEELPITSSHVRIIIMVTEEVESPKLEVIDTTLSNHDPNVIDALCGVFKNHLSSSETFAQRKEEDIKREEEKWASK